jgi:hypothetical protein
MAISNQVIERSIDECLQCLRWCSQCRDESLTQDPGHDEGMHPALWRMP